MTWAEQLREEGRAEERKHAEEERRRAEEATRRAEELLAKMRQRTLASLRRRFGALPDEAIRKVEVATEEQLDAIEANLDDAKTLDDLLR